MNIVVCDANIRADLVAVLVLYELAGIRLFERVISWGLSVWLWLESHIIAKKKPCS